MPDPKARFTANEIVAVIEPYHELLERAQKIASLMLDHRRTSFYDNYIDRIDFGRQAVVMYYRDSAHGEETDCVYIPIDYFGVSDEAITADQERIAAEKRAREEARLRQVREAQHLKNREEAGRLINVALERYPGLVEGILAQRAEQPC